MLRLRFVLAICANQFFFWLIVAFFHPYLFIYSVIYLFIYLFCVIVTNGPCNEFSNLSKTKMVFKDFVQ